VAGTLARSGQHEQAATVAHSITFPDWQARALAEVAGALARSGQHEQAATVAHSITDPDRQVQALTEVAKALMARGDTRQAHQAASAACTVGRWTTVLELVLSLEPSALRVLTDL
jgi:C4-dicarboxylate-specific signal transduction histidine kinase